MAWLPSRRLPAFLARRGYSSSAGQPYRILFCGTDDFAKTTLAALHGATDVCDSLTVLTARDAPNAWQSRKRVAVSPVKEWATEAGLAHDMVPPTGLLDWHPPTPFDGVHTRNLLLTASFGHLIPPSLLALFPPTQRLNLHPSLLPQLSGAAPIQWAIARQQDRTGVTVQTLGERFDSGSIYAQDEVAIPPGSTYTSLETELAKHGAQLLLRVLRNLDELADNAWPQSRAPPQLLPSRAPKLKRSHSEVKWAEWTAADVVARHRGFGYLYPLTTTLAGSKRILLRNVEVASEEKGALASTHPPGSATFSPRTQTLLIWCKDGGSVLGVRRLQSEGKREMDAAQWIVGYRDRADGAGMLHFE